MQSHGIKGNIVGCAGLGGNKAEIVYGALETVKANEFTQKPQLLIIPAKALHFVEEECLEQYKIL